MAVLLNYLFDCSYVFPQAQRPSIAVMLIDCIPASISSIPTAASVSRQQATKEVATELFARYKYTDDADNEVQVVFQVCLFSCRFRTHEASCCAWLMNTQLISTCYTSSMNSHNMYAKQTASRMQVESFFITRLTARQMHQTAAWYRHFLHLSCQDLCDLPFQLAGVYSASAVICTVWTVAFHDDVTVMADVIATTLRLLTNEHM